MKLTLNGEDAMNRVWAESAWKVAAEPELPLLTPDNERLVSLYMKEGFDEICSRLSGYTQLTSYNRNTNTANIIMWLNFRHYCPDSIAQAIALDIVEALAQYALMRFYGDVSYYSAAYRRAVAHILLCLARDANAL
ncbi:MAG: hypothetical protein IK092_04525 [Muribaculaceae bacterium]|nr:hypothetical protein [Muribaculaceae bacterium]